jgi:hypothetical protein
MNECDRILTFFTSYVAASVAHFISFEVRSVHTLCRLRLLAPFWHWALIAVLWMEMIVDMPTKFCRSMEPGANAYEDPVNKPFWTVVASGSTRVRRDVIVAVRTIRGYADVDADLSPGRRGDSR